MSKSKENKGNQLLFTGFAFFFPGAFLALNQEFNWLIQAIGVVLIIIASMLFGASIATNARRRKE